MHWDSKLECCDGEMIRDISADDESDGNAFRGLRDAVFFSSRCPFLLNIRAFRLGWGPRVLGGRSRLRRFTDQCILVITVLSCRHLFGRIDWECPAPS